MGRRSTLEDKSIYQISRENAGLTREEAENACPGLTADRIVKIEHGHTAALPEDVVLMSRCYRDPSLRNKYCASECPLGRGTVPELQSKELAQIAVETLNSLNRLSREKDRLLEIVEDGTVREDERHDFLLIKDALDKISISARTMQLWIDEAEASGKLPKDFLK